MAPTYTCGFGCKHPLLSRSDVSKEAKRLYDCAFLEENMKIAHHFHYLYESMSLGHVRAHEEFYRLYRYSFLKYLDENEEYFDVKKFIHEHGQSKYMDEFLVVTFLDNKEFFNNVINSDKGIDIDKIMIRAYASGGWLNWRE